MKSSEESRFLLRIKLPRLPTLAEMATEVKDVPIFAGVDPSTLDLLAREAREVRVGKGDRIVKEGEPGNTFYLVLEGSVRVCKRLGTVEEVELSRLGPGEFFGEMCILETLPRSASVQAVSKTMLLALSSVTFYHVFQKNPAEYCILLLNIARDLSRRLRRLDEVFPGRH